MQICRLTVPGLSTRRDGELARRRLLGDFPDVHEVIATTAPSTLLILYSGDEQVDDGLDALLDSIAPTQSRPRRGWPTWRDRSRGGFDSAA